MCLVVDQLFQVYIQNMFVVLGGIKQTANGNEPVLRIHSFRPTTKTWHQLGYIKHPRSVIGNATPIDSANLLLLGGTMGEVCKVTDGAIPAIVCEGTWYR